MLLLIILQ